MLAKSGDHCTYNFFAWHYSDSCPKLLNNESCIVDVPDYDQRLDLSILKKTSYDVYSADKSRHFQLNICGGIQKYGQCPEGTFLCEITEESSSVIVDKNAKMVNFYADQVYLDYIGKSNKATIVFVCDEVATTIEFTSQTDDVYTFTVKTPHLCMVHTMELSLIHI